MGIRLGNFDPLQLIFGILNILLKKKVITAIEAREILEKALPSEMTVGEKARILNSMIRQENS